MQHLVIRHVMVKALPIYTCNACLGTASGELVRREIDTPGSDLIRECLPVSNTHMPLGWRSDGPTVHTCPACQRS